MWDDDVGCEIVIVVMLDVYIGREIVVMMWDSDDDRDSDSNLRW